MTDALAIRDPVDAMHSACATSRIRLASLVLSLIHRHPVALVEFIALVIDGAVTGVELH